MEFNSMLLAKEAIHQVRTLKSAKYFTSYFPLVRILTKSDFTETIDIHFWSHPTPAPSPPHYLRTYFMDVPKGHIDYKEIPKEKDVKKDMKEDHINPRK